MKPEDLSEVELANVFVVHESVRVGAPALQYLLSEFSLPGAKTGFLQLF